jgi:mannose-1-phosphate guanylyltransferase/mannose-6-phosphate isomerase
MPAARSGALVAFGIAPDHPETGYGYMRRGAPLRSCPDCFKVEYFVEKPDLATARKYLAEGGYLWNSGIMLLKAAQYLTELAHFEPEMLATVQEAVKHAVCDLDFVRLNRTAFVAARACSLDYAVMEKTDATVVTPVEIGWTDVGSWDALWHATAKDCNGNALLGDVVAADVCNSYIRAENRLVAAVGLTNIVLVETADAVLAVARDRSQDLRQVVGRLAEAGRNEREQHRRVYRPWGSYEQIDCGERHQVKRIIVKPGGRLSLQKHAHRSEHWVVVRGTARVTRGQDIFDLHENEGTYIAVGTVHRMENLTPEHLHLIEVQTGDYLGEDDIVRLDDSYGRA